MTGKYLPNRFNPLLLLDVHLTSMLWKFEGLPCACMRAGLIEVYNTDINHEKKENQKIRTIETS